ncbi:hypothetical protein PTR23_04790 [Serratia nevei]|uniref:hypothetical protein n=1 Tax=Serratia TaxID=613 RepID=UPI001CC0E8BA|nr:hypothetical protein [Serratia marcescens]BEN38660.1 hypothetical protein SMKC049_04520 [Serratia marcescens]
MKANVEYKFHHFGIPVQDGGTSGKYSAGAGMYTTDNSGTFRVQWHRFTEDSPLHPLLKTVPHVAFKVSSLAEAIAGEKAILGPYEPIDDYRVAVIDDCGVPTELIETSLSDEDLWARVAIPGREVYIASKMPVIIRSDYHHASTAILAWCLRPMVGDFTR